MVAVADLRPGLRVYDAHGALLGAVKEVISREEALRLRGGLEQMLWRDPADMPPPEDFPYLVVEARGHEAPGQTLYSGYYIPAHAVVSLDRGEIRLSGTLADLDNLGWNMRPGFLP